MIAGVDRSHLNGTVPLINLWQKGIKFIWFKATQAATFIDPMFNHNWQEAKSIIGLARGAYHFFDPRIDGIVQAKLLLAQGINFSGVGCLPPCIDVEDLVVMGVGGRVDPVATAAANKWVADNYLLAISRLTAFLTYIKQQTGRDCIIYSYNNYMKEYLHGTKFLNNGFWLSSLQETCPARYDNGVLPQFWQNTYAWNGSDMDGDFFTGTQQQLNQLANINS